MSPAKKDGEFFICKDKKYKAVKNNSDEHVCTFCDLYKICHDKNFSCSDTLNSDEYFISADSFVDMFNRLVRKDA